MHLSAKNVLRTFTLAIALGLIGVNSASAARTGGVSLNSPVVPTTVTQPTVPGLVAKLQADGTAAAPEGAPAEVQQAIWAANKLIGKPYKYGGGHGKVNDTGYDCSGTVSFALRASGHVKTPLDSSSFMRWAEAGVGEWITVYTNPGHAFVVIAGLRLDTSASGDPSGNKGPRWRPALRSTKGFKARHPEGF